MTTKPQVNLDEAEDRAKRSLDGMTINRTAMAREHLQMVDELRAWRRAFERMKAEKPGTSFADLFKGFGNPFGG